MWPIKNFIRSYRDVNNFLSSDQSKRELVFYSETKADLNHLNPLMKQLNKKYGQYITYLTSDLSDPLLQSTSPLISTYYIGHGIMRTKLFHEINTMIMVSCLADLGNYYLKRSFNPVHYVYVANSMFSYSMSVREKAFNNFDTVMLVGPHHKQELEFLEKYYHLKHKNLWEIGYFRLTELIKEKEISNLKHLQKDSKLLSIVIAPSWGPNSLSHHCLFPMIKSLLDYNYKVVFRPHPMEQKQYPKLIKKVEKMFGPNKLFTLELDLTNKLSLQKSDIMISDWSGAALDFSFTYERPVIFIDTPKKILNHHYEKFPCQPLEITVRNKLGIIITPDEAHKIGEKIDWRKLQGSKLKEKIKSTRNQYVYNINNSVDSGAEKLYQLLQRLKEKDKIIDKKLNEVNPTLLNM